MEIALVDVDSHNYPNIPLMKISAWHKKNGDNVEFVKKEKHYDCVYMSKIFTESCEPNYINAEKIIRGGSGYDLENKLPDEIEHSFPDYSLYEKITNNTAYGMLTRGCPCRTHSFCITPKKDGYISKKVANLKDFWNGQKKIVLLDQNILACKDRMELLRQLADSKAFIEFDGGMDIRYMSNEIIEMFRNIRVNDFHFAWDDPKENLASHFKKIEMSGIKNTNSIGVYVLVNYWSSIEEDLYRIYTLRNMGFMPFVMIFNKLKYVNSRGRWLEDVGKYFTKEQMMHFKICQHMQRWCGNRKLIKAVPNFNDYEPYKNWINKGKPVPESIN